MTDDDRIDALLASLRLKDETRTGWERTGIANPESVADHSWGVALLALTYAEEAGVDSDRAVRLALLHDLPEAETGDLPTRAEASEQPVSPAEKRRRESAAVDRFEPLDVGLRDAWVTYDARDTDCARFVKDMDLVEMCLQALYYEQEERYEPDPEHEPDPEGEGGDEDGHLDEFFESARARIETPVGERLYREIRARYEAVRG